MWLRYKADGRFCGLYAPSGQRAHFLRYNAAEGFAMIPFAGGAVPPVHSILCQKRSGLPGAGGGISNKFCPGNLWGQMPLYVLW